MDTNLLYYGDNLDILRRDIPGESGQKTDALRLRAGGCDEQNLLFPSL